VLLLLESSCRRGRSTNRTATSSSIPLDRIGHRAFGDRDVAHLEGTMDHGHVARVYVAQCANEGNDIETECAVRLPYGYFLFRAIRATMEWTGRLHTMPRGEGQAAHGGDGDNDPRGTIEYPYEMATDPICWRRWGASRYFVGSGNKPVGQHEGVAKPEGKQRAQASLSPLQTACQSRRLPPRQEVYTRFGTSNTITTAINKVPTSVYYKRIGNMVLMQAKDNSIIGNVAFDQKEPILAASPYAFTSMVGKYSKWGTVEIEDRQRILAEWAVKTWPIRIK